MQWQTKSGSYGLVARQTLIRCNSTIIPTSMKESTELRVYTRHPDFIREAMVFREAYPEEYIYE